MIIRSILAVLTSRVIGSGAYFLVNIIFIQILTKEEYAEYFFYFSLIPLLSFFMNLGLNRSYLIGSKTKNIDDADFFNIKLAIISIFSLFSIFLYFNGLILYSYVFSCAALFGFVESTLLLLQSRGEFRLYSILSSFRNLFWLFLIAFYTITNANENTSVEQSLLFLLIASLGSVVFSLVIVFKKIKIKFSYIIKSKNLFKLCKEYFWVDLCAALMVRMEIWIISLYISFDIINKEELANFSAAFSIAFVIPLITSAVYNVLLPEFVSNKDIHKNCYRTLKKNRGKIFLISFFILLFSPIMVRIILPDNYDSSILLFVFIAQGMLFTFFNNVSQIAIAGAALDRKIKRNSLIQTGSSLLFCIVLTPILGAIGAALSMLLSRFVGIILTLLVLKRMEL